MGLKEEQEELKAQIAALEKEETEKPEEVVEETVEEDPEEDEGEAPPQEEAAPEPAEEKLSDAAYAKMRRENKALREQLAQAQKAREPVEESQEEQAPLPPILNEIVTNHYLQKAGQEFNQLENEFKKVQADYEGVANSYKQALFNSNYIQNPSLSQSELVDITNRQLLLKANAFQKRGLDPIEELYEEAKSLGFKAQEIQETEETTRPDMAKVAANRQRNAGTAGAKGRGGVAVMTQAAAADLPVSEWKKLPIAERQRLMRGG